MENHQDNLWSLSAQKYFRLEEPRIIKKIFRISARKGTKKIRSIRLICVRPFLSRELPEFSDYGEIRIQETMCFIT